MANRVYPSNQTRFQAYAEPGPLTDEPQYHPNFAPAGRVETRSNLVLNSAAERVGNMVGNAVEKVKELPDRLQDMKKRFTVIRGRSTEELSSKAGEMAEDVKEKAQRTVSDARTRAELMARENPMRFIAGAAILGVVLGIVLRFWRDHGD
jgi:ElaB/YqjD/DUF883 family membrane-anchored ribosome-binding protein